MKKGIVVAALVAVCVSCATKGKVEWVSSTNTSPWVVATVDVASASAGADGSTGDVVVNTSRTQQTIEGFGGCFNEMGWDALNKLNPADRDLIVKMLFDQTDGCKFNLCRMPLGANDYSMNFYSYNETPGDVAMANFSIDRDRQLLIPYIHEAQKHFPRLRIWASPWCPPSWMKTNNHYACYPYAKVNDLASDKAGKEMVDQFRMEEPYLKAYALYFSKFIEAYRQEGITIEAVHVQNEPNSCQVFPSCVWTPASLGRFIAGYLGPQFEADKLSTNIWLGTIERPQIGRVDSVLNYPGAMKYITGVGFQWAGKGAIPEVHRKYPQLQLMQTETECGDGSNDWAAALHTWELMKHYFDNGANAYMYWNMVLDETGISYWGWKQNSMISIDKASGKVVYNPEFYLMKHLSYFVEPGSKYIPVNSDPNCLAFVKGKNLVVFYYNDSETGSQKTFTAGGKSISVELNPKSFNTFKIRL
jgi:glucosylceramidase